MGQSRQPRRVRRKAESPHPCWRTSTSITSSACGQTGGVITPPPAASAFGGTPTALSSGSDAQQGQWLCQVVRGYFAYHAVPTNVASLSAFRHHVVDLWRRSLKRRSQKDHTTWDRLAHLAADFLPAPRILHPWPDARFAVTHPS